MLGRERREPKPFPNLEAHLIQANSIVDEPFTFPLYDESSLPLEISPADLKSQFADSIIALRTTMHDVRAIHSLISLRYDWMRFRTSNGSCYFMPRTLIQ